MSAPWIPQTTQRIRTMTVKVIGAGLAGWGLYSGWKTARDRMAAKRQYSWRGADSMWSSTR